MIWTAEAMARLPPSLKGRGRGWVGERSETDFQHFPRLLFFASTCGEQRDEIIAIGGGGGAGRLGPVFGRAGGGPDAKAHELLGDRAGAAPGRNPPPGGQGGGVEAAAAAE